MSALVERRTLQFAGLFAAGAMALATIPFFGLPAFYETFLYLVFHWIVLATSWNILSGYSGYVSFGHGAFFGLGVYATATLAGRYRWPFLATLPVAAVAAACLGIALGGVVFRVKRVRGELFALLTLAVTFVLATIILNTPIDGGPGIYLSAVRLPAIGPTPASTFYLLELTLATATLAIAWWIARSRLGSGLFAIHDDEDVAEVLGVPTFRCQQIAVAVSCGLAGVAGGIQAVFVSYVTVADTFSITVPLTVILMSVLGGARHWAGPAIGAAAITVVSYASTAGDHVLAGKAAVGVILIAVILFMPEGILGTLLARRARAARGAREPKAAPATATSGQLPSPVPTPVHAHRHQAGARLLSLRGVRRAFAGVQALDGVDLDVYRGEILGLLGPNGSGKSTLVNVVSGHYRADSGSILFDGESVEHWPAHRVARLGLARTYQIPRPFAHFSVLDNVVLTAMFGAPALPRREAVREARRCLDFTGLADKAHALPAELNLHQRKFLELSRALASRPRLLLLDEVLSGLTPAEIDSAVLLVRRIHAQGTTIVLVEHLMRAVMALADRIVVLDQGRVIAQGMPADVMAETAVKAAYLGTADAAS